MVVGMHPGGDNLQRVISSRYVQFVKRFPCPVPSCRWEFPVHREIERNSHFPSLESSLDETTSGAAKEQMILLDYSLSTGMQVRNQGG